MVTDYFGVMRIIYKIGGKCRRVSFHIVDEIILGQAEIKQFRCIFEFVFTKETSGPDWLRSVKHDIDGSGFFVDNFFVKSSDVNTLMVHEHDDVRAG